MNTELPEPIGKEAAELDKHELARLDREKHVDAVLQSKSTKKIVVAGPGTGKTYLFKRILEGKKPTLTLTFVNSLVEDLSLDLCGISAVKTLHGFALSVMKTATNQSIKLFPKLEQVIKEDAIILLAEAIDFDHLFHNREDENSHIGFYKKRKDFYAYYGYADIVFAAVKYFEKKKDKIPAFQQVVVDELQDFNLLEICLIDLLAEKSPILLAGDDDQALYESLKSASPKHIRQRHNDNSFGYEAFCLPYCSRCTRVIVEAVNDIVTGASQDGYLKGRIAKPFTYFDDKEKDRDCDNNPYLEFAQLFSKQIPWLIEKNIEQLANEVKGQFSVLIISPTRTQSRRIVTALKQKGFKNLLFVEKRDSEEPSLLDGLTLLLANPKCNLGWRVVAKELLSEAEFEKIMRSTDGTDAKPIADLVTADVKKDVSQMLKIVGLISKDKDLPDEDAFAELLKRFDVDVYKMAKQFLKNELDSRMPSNSNPAIRKTPITATTIQSSKGLAADYVFITHFDDKYFVKDTDKTKISDQDICNFLVALTRARKKVFLISSETTKTPAFLDWIEPERIHHMKVKSKAAP
jgi:superfamily I DNA/RNA helicase